MNEVEMKATLHRIIANNSEFTTWTVSTPHLMMLIKEAVKQEREQIIAITKTQEFSRMYGEFTPSAYDLVKAIQKRGETI